MIINNITNSRIIYKIQCRENEIWETHLQYEFDQNGDLRNKTACDSRIDYTVEKLKAQVDKWNKLFADREYRLLKITHIEIIEEIK